MSETQTPAPTPATPDAKPAPKPGYKTTEFWLGLFAMLLSAAYAAGLIPTEGDASSKGWVKAVALVAMALTALGYAVSRGNAKK